MGVQIRLIPEPLRAVVGSLHRAPAHMMTPSDSSSDAHPGRAKRVRPGPLRVRLHRECEGILVNISETGALVQVPWALAPDKQISFRLEIEDASLQLSGRVVRTKPQQLQMAEATLARMEYQVAVEFSDLPPEQAAALHMLLKTE